VRGIDRANNIGAWAYSRTLSPRVVQQSSSAVRFSGTWGRSSDSRFSGGSARYTSTSGKAVSYTFTGRSVALVALRAPSRGKARVYVNGTYQATVDLYRSSSLFRAVAWQKTWSTTATRTIRVVVLGTGGRPRVEADAFVVVK
jgi:outer membrane translocation and assembly module TamA